LAGGLPTCNGEHFAIWLTCLTIGVSQSDDRRIS